MESADLFRIPLWLLTKAAYTFMPISLLLRLASLRGSVDSLFSSKRVEVAEALERHLGATIDAGERGVIARRHFQFRRRARFARLWPQIRGFADADKVEIEGLDALDRALAGGKGAILVSAHFGHARLVKPILRSRGREVLLVGNLRPGMPDFRPEFFGMSAFTRVGSFIHTGVLRLPRWSRFHERFRRTTGVDLAAELNMRPHVAALGRNETLVILADGRRARAPRRISILGVGVHLAPGAASMARMTGAPLLPAFVFDDVSKGVTGIRLVIQPPLELHVTADSKADLEANLQLLAATLEEQVRTSPHTWHWHATRDGVLDPLLVER